jgi:hypothetical protein
VSAREFFGAVLIASPLALFALILVITVNF